MDAVYGAIHRHELQAMRIGSRMLRIPVEALEAHKARLAGALLEPVTEPEEMRCDEVSVVIQVEWGEPRTNRFVDSLRQIESLERAITYVRLNQHRADLEDGLRVDPARFEKLCQIAGSVMRLDAEHAITAGAYSVVQAYARFRDSHYASAEGISFLAIVHALIEAITNEIGEPVP